MLLAPWKTTNLPPKAAEPTSPPGDNISTAVETTVCRSRHPDITGHPSSPEEGHARSHPMPSRPMPPRFMASRLLPSRLFATPQPSHSYVTAGKAASSLCVCLPFAKRVMIHTRRTRRTERLHFGRASRSTIGGTWGPRMDGQSTFRRLLPCPRACTWFPRRRTPHACRTG